MKGRVGKVVPATARLIGRLMAYIPAEDDEDMRRGWGLSSADAILLSYQTYKPSYIIMADDQPVAIFGCAPDGNIWMMRGEGIESVSIQLIRQAQPYFDRWIGEHGHIYAYFWGGNRKLLRFVEWSGFSVTKFDSGYVRCDKWAQSVR